MPPKKLSFWEAWRMCPAADRGRRACADYRLVRVATHKPPSPQNAPLAEIKDHYLEIFLPPVKLTPVFDSIKDMYNVKLPRIGFRRKTQME